MEPTATHIGIEPGSGLIGRFGDTVILIPGAPRPPAVPMRPPGNSLTSPPPSPPAASGGRHDGGAAGRLGYRPHVRGRHSVRDCDARGRRRGRVPARCGVVLGHRRLRNPPAVRRAGADLGRSDAARYVRAAGDRRHGGPAGAGGSDVGPPGRSGARAGFRADPDRQRPGAGTSRVRCGRKAGGARGGRPGRPPRRMCAVRANKSLHLARARSRRPQPRRSQPRSPAHRRGADRRALGIRRPVRACPRDAGRDRPEPGTGLASLGGSSKR